MKNFTTQQLVERTISALGSYFLLTFYVLLLGCTAQLSAQDMVCASAEKVLVKWDFNSNTQACNGLSATQRRYWIPSVPLMTGGNQYCPQINDGSGQSKVFEKGFGNTNDFKNMMCLAGFWKNSGNIYFRAPGYDHTSPTYNPNNPSGNVWFSYNFLPGQAGSLTGFNFDYIQSGYRDGGTVAFDKVGMSVWRNGVMIYETTTPLTASNVNNPANPVQFPFPTGSEFTTDGSTEVVWEIAFALVKRNKSVRVGADNYCILGTTGGATADVTATPATCAPAGGMNGQLTVTGFSVGEKYDYTEGPTYTGTANFSNAPVIPANGVIANTLPISETAVQYTVRVFRADCYVEQTVFMPPVFCPYTCDFPDATATPNPATCTGDTPNSDATIVLTGITNMDRVGISSGRTYTGPLYAGAELTNGASTLTFDSSDGVVAGACTEYYTFRFFNGAEDATLCVQDVTVAMSAISCDGCQVICAELTGTDSEEVNSANNSAQAEACRTDNTVDLEITKTVNNATGENCPNETDFVFTVTVDNIGDLTANDITIQDDFPDEMVISSAVASSGAALVSFGTIDWSIPQLAPMGQATLTITGKFLVPGAFMNCAYVTSVSPSNDPDDTNDNDCASVTVTGSQLPTLAKSFSPEFVRPNVPFRLKINITNNEPTPIALTADLVDVLPSSPGQMVIAATPALSSNLPDVIATAGTTQIVVPSGTVLQPGLNTITVDVTVPVSGDYSNVIPAGALQTTACSNPEPALAEVSVSEDNVIAPLVSKDFGADVIVTGQTTQLTIIIENRNTQNFTLVADFVDEMPAGIVVIGTPTSSCGGATAFGSTDRVGLLAGTVIAGNTACTIEVDVQGAVAGEHCNRIIFNEVGVEVATSPPTATANEDVAEACIEVVDDPVFDLALRKVLNPTQPATVTPGETVNFQITVFNQGTATATDVQVTEYIPTGMSLGTTSLWEMSGDNAVLVSPIASMAPGEDITLDIPLVVSNSFTGTSIINVAEISSSTGGVDVDSTPDNDPLNDDGGAVDTPSDNVILGNGKAPGGAPGETSGLSDEDDADPAKVNIMLVCTAELTAMPSSCVPGTNQYSVSGTVTYNTPPESGTLTVSVDGQQQVFNAPFSSSPQAYTITGLTSDGVAKTVTATFSEDPTCTNTANYTAPVNCTPVSCSIIPTNPVCDGDTNGQIVVTGSGGTGSYLYSLNGGTARASGTFTGLGAGLQTVTVQDANNVTNSSTCMETLVAPPAVTCDITFSNPTSAGGTNGSITATGTGGSGSFQYSLNGGTFQTSGTFTGLSAGLQTVTVRDAGATSCTSTCMVTLADGCGVTITALPGECNALTNEYTVTGDLAFTTEPNTGTLTVTIDGETQVFNAPFTSPQAYSISGLPSDGGSHTASVVFSADGNCANTVDYTAPADCKPCSMVLSATPGDCTPGSNTYDLSGSITFDAAPTSGTLTVSAAGQTQVFNAPFTSPQAFVISGLTSDGQSATVSAQFSADLACQSSLVYEAPDPCGDAMSCTVAVTAVPGDCDPATNTYDLSGQVTFTDSPSTGTMTVSVGAFQQVFSAPFVSPASYNLTGLAANGSSNTVVVSFSANPSCLDYTDFVAPIGCTPAACNVSMTASAGACKAATNTYDLTGSVTFNNAPASGQLIIQTDGGSQSFNVGSISSPQAFIISDLIASGGSRIVNAYFTADPNCTANFFYQAAEPCGGSMVCAANLAVTPSPCSDGTYTLGGTVDFVDAPTTGTLTISEGAIVLVTVNLPTASPLSFSLPQLTADGAVHTLDLVFSDDGSCNDQVTYQAPAACVGACDLMATIGNTNCNNNGTATDTADDYITFELNPTGSSLGTGYTVTASSGIVYTLAGSLANDVAYGGTTTFRLENGSAGAGNVIITIADATNPDCSDTGTLTDPGVCSEPVCSMVLSATPTDCSQPSGNYSLGGTITFDNAPTSGSLIVYVDGVAEATFTSPFNSPQTFAVFGLSSDGQQHTITAEFTVDATCAAALDYNAPAPCGSPTGCTVAVTAVPGDCESPLSEYDLAGEITFDSAPTSGTLTVAVGPFQQVFNAPFVSPLSYRLNNLSANGSVGTVTVSFSADANCLNSTTYAAPGACTPDECTLTLTAEAGDCVVASNKFDVTGELTFDDAPATGTLTVSAGGVSQEFTSFTSPQAYTLAGLIADGSQVTVVASFSADANCSASQLIDAPESCAPAVCALDLAVSPTPCADGEYILGGTLTFVNAPSSGTLIIREGGTDLLTVALPASSPLGFAIPGLTADGATHNLTAFFSDDTACSDPVSYDAPATCTGPCDVMATVMNIECNDNGTIIDGVDDYITFSLNPTGTNTGTSYSVTSSAGQVFLLSGAAANNVPFGTETYFRMQNGSAGAGDVTITVDDNDSPLCTTDAGLVDPGDCEATIFLDLALTKVLNTSITPGPFEPGDEVTFEIEIINQGLIQAVDIQVTDYFPEELILTDDNWTASGQTATLITPIASLDAETSTTRNITFTISEDYEGICLINWAEISAADPSFLVGLIYDIDSDPDNMQFNGPGETDDLDDDNVVDEDGKNNAGEDEDDHDPAKVDVQNVFDLALFKTPSGAGPFVP
ncbi:MAG: hypothetical protein AB8H12_09905, partial [Lewinella sp.]